MNGNGMLSLVQHWADEIVVACLENESVCIAVFSVSGELVYANKAMSALFKGVPSQSLINPAFNVLTTIESDNSLIFKGYITVGDLLSVNSSIQAHVYRKNNELLIIGGMPFHQLLETNESLHRLNRENLELQRELIREKRKLEETLVQYNAANVELQKLSTDKDRFISILGHDLKNPFNSILGFLQLLRSNIHRYDMEKIEKQLSIIHNSADHTYNLLEDILSWAHAQSSSFPFEPEIADFCAICTEVNVELKAVAMAKSITVVFPSSDCVPVYADVNMLKSVLRNLITNALKFSETGGHVEVKASHSTKEVIVSVADNGIGMEPEVAADLFDLTKKFSTKGTAGEHGTGIGLLLCKDFVEKHGGQIWVDSTPGLGSTFSLSLPNRLIGGASK